MRSEFLACDVSSDYSVKYNFVDAHAGLIKTITGCSKNRAQQLANMLQIRDFQVIPHFQLQDMGFTDRQIEKLSAAIALGGGLERGFNKPDHLQSMIDDPAIAAKPFMALFGGSRVEQFGVMVLNVKHKIMHVESIAKGTETEVLANPRVIMECVLRYGGTRFIVAHNHPSGNLSPSPEDISITDQLIKASKVMEVPLLDHLIVTRRDFVSLRQMTDLWTFEC